MDSTSLDRDLFSWSFTSYESVVKACSSETAEDLIKDIRTHGETCYTKGKAIAARPPTIRKGRFVFAKDSQYIFNQYGVEDIHSYPSLGIRRERKMQYPLHHGYIELGERSLGGGLNTIECRDIEELKEDTIPLMLIRNDYNYWHWHFDALPRIFILAITDVVKRDSEFISFYKLREYQIESLVSILGYEPNIRIIESDRFMSNTYYVHGPFPSYYHTWFCRRFSSHLKKGLLSVSRHGERDKKRIYIRRGVGLNARDICDTLLLDKTLEEYGFKSFDTGKMKYAEQARLFNEAEVIVGVHGAAFANILFCEQRCKVIELFPENLRLTHENLLAFNLGVAWNRIFCNTNESGGLIYGEREDSGLRCLLEDWS